MTAPARKPGRPRKIQRPKRRAPGTGSVIVHTSGRVQALDARDAAGHREHYEARGLTVEQRIADATAWLDARVAARARAAGLAPETVEQYLERWLWQTYHPPKAPLTTYRQYRTHLAWAACIGDVLVPELTRDHGLRIDDAMLAAGRSARYVRAVRGTLRRAFAPLVPKVIAENPIGPPRRPLTIPRRRPRAWDEDQRRAFHGASRGTRWAPMWTLMGTYGIRPGEARGLQWPDLDERAGTLHVQRNLQVGKREGDTKNHAPRVIKLLRDDVDELVAFRDAASSWTSPTWMFCLLPGEPMSEHALADEFAAIVARANEQLVADALAEGLTPAQAQRRRLPTIKPHGLRHTSATLLLRRGVSVAKVSELLGHHSPAFTYSQYAWAVPSDDEVVERALLAIRGEEAEPTKRGE